MQRFEAYLHAHLPAIETFHPHYQAALRAMLMAGGKRFRPKLLLSIVEAHEPLLYEGALPVALAVEMLHTYSLIHDDLPVMDDADLRRGVQTLHRRYDEETAILVGDALNTDAFLLIAEAPLRADIKIELIKLLAQNGGSQGMVLGQALDCHFEEQALSIEQIKVLHIHKTAKLIAASLAMGAVVVGLDRTVRDWLYDFGIDLGLLFQIQDDLIDEMQSDLEAGKSTGKDSHKNSFVTLLGVEGAIAQADQLSETLTQQLGEFDATLQGALTPMIKHYLHRYKG
jgi:geranylgeranyl diphosphate synthase type II